MKKLILGTDKVIINIFNDSNGSSTPKVYRTVILKPNIINGVNVLSQDLFAYDNTKYIIKYTYDLLGEEIVIPENCVVEFDGGSVNNGTLVGQNTGLILLWGNNTATFTGSWKNLIDSSESIEEELEKKVDKVPGKQLSTNDFTDTYKDTLENLPTVAITGNYEDLTNKPDLADVATSGSYLDLTNKPEDSAIIQVTLTTEIDQFTSSGTTDVTLAQFQQMLYNYKHNIFAKCNIDGIDSYYKLQGYTSQDQTISVIFGPGSGGDLIQIAWQEGEDTYVIYYKYFSQLLDNKVNKIEGKGLSTNDFTNADKTKLEGIESGAQVNVKSDWDAQSGDAQILNKPTTLAGYGITDAASSSDIQNINAKIPAQASAQNQLADKDFVNSSIGTNTGDFKGTYQNVNDLPTSNVKNNDYAFVIATDQGGDPSYKRYKYTITGSTGQWTYEYTLNNSSFTAAQWKAIQSGITSDLVSKLSNLPDSTSLNTQLDNKVDKVPGKGLSTNDYTTAEKNKLAGIAAGAEVNVQSDWNESNSNSDAFIKNKPTIPDITGKADKVSSATNGHLAGLNSSGNLTDSGVIADNVIQSTSVKNIVVLTQAEFDALTTYDNNTEYNVI